MNMTPLNIWFAKLLTAQGSGWITPVIASAISALAVWLTSFGIEMTPETQAKVVLALVALAMTLINAWTNKVLTDGNKAAQDILDNAVPQAVSKDGVIGPKFLGAFTELALSSVNKSTPKP